MSKIASFCRIPDGSIPGNPNMKGFNQIFLYESPAEYDKLTKILTYGTIVLLIVLDIWITYQAIVYNVFSIIIFINILLISIIVVPYLFSPLEYILTSRGILVRRILRSFLLPYNDIKEVKKIAWTWRRIRLFASGGLYGFYGLFKFMKLGDVWMYVTDRHKTILLELNDETKYIISPYDTDEFIKKMRELTSIFK